MENRRTLPARARAEPLASRLAVALCFLLSAAAGELMAQPEAGASDPAIELRPREVLILVQPATVRVTGLPAGAEVTLDAELADAGGGPWRSSAVFRADAEGVVDLERDAPLTGAWEGVDPSGPIWSMTAAGPPVEEDGAGVMPKDRSLVRFDVKVGGQVVASKTLMRWHFNPSLRRTEVRDGGLVATFQAAPANLGSLPGVIVLGGSGGGIDYQEGAARLLASAGFATLALAYFGMEGLPENLERIPLEYFQTALRWLQQHPVTDPERIGVVGVSKGGELALLLGSRFPEIKAVAAWVPGSAVFQSIAPGWPATSSWTWEGEDLPFVPYRPGAKYLESQQLVDLYDASLDQAEAFAAAAIPVEKINGPVLLFSGRDDTLWPATRMSEQIIERLRANGGPHAAEHVAFDEAGHLIARLPYFPGIWATGRGGTPRGIARAQIESWRRLPIFLAEALAAPPPPPADASPPAPPAPDGD